MEGLCSFSDEEDVADLELIFNVLPRPPIFRDRRDLFEELSNIEFKRRYRLNKSTVFDLTELLAPNIDPFTNRSFPIYAMDQVFICLRYYATGSFQMTLGDIVGIHQTTVGVIVHKVTREIAKLRPLYVKMPSTEEQRTTIKQGFFAIAGFPGVVGCVDGSHIKIKSPTREFGEAYRNRKGWFSINIQSVCDHNLRAMDIVAKWPGSSHGMTIFDNSLVRAQFENGEFQRDLLLGDSGYACRQYLITPLGNPESTAQINFNKAHITTRNTIERMFGVIKRRFPCLAVGMQIKKDKIYAVIVATVVLHNIAKDHNDEDPPVDPEITLPASAYDIIHLPYEGTQNNFAVRNAIVDSFFS